MNYGPFQMCRLDRGLLLHLALGIGAFAALFAMEKPASQIAASVIYFGGLLITAAICNS